MQETGIYRKVQKLQVLLVGRAYQAYLKVFVDCDSDERLIRNIQRDTIDRGRTVTVVVDRYRKVLKPMHEQFIEPTKRYADIIIPEGGENINGIGILCKYIEGLVPKDKREAK